MRKKMLFLKTSLALGLFLAFQIGCLEVGSNQRAVSASKNNPHSQEKYESSLSGIEWLAPPYRGLFNHPVVIWKVVRASSELADPWTYIIFSEDGWIIFLDSEAISVVTAKYRIFQQEDVGDQLIRFYVEDEWFDGSILTYKNESLMSFRYLGRSGLNVTYDCERVPSKNSDDLE